MARAPGRAPHSLGNLRAVLGQALKTPGVREPRRSTGPGVDQSCHWDASGGGGEDEQRAHGTMSGTSLSRGTDLCLRSQEMVKSLCCGLNCFFCSVAQLCPTLSDPMDCSMPGFSVLHYLLELAQTNVHRVGDAIQPSHPLSSPSSPALSLSLHHGLCQ